jgi:hypothetical protein
VAIGFSSLEKYITKRLYIYFSLLLQLIANGCPFELIVQFTHKHLNISVYHSIQLFINQGSAPKMTTHSI